MTRINAREARARFAQLLDSAHAGQTIAITRRGKTVAVLAPPRPRTGRPLPDMASFHKTLRIRGKSLAQTVIDMRRHARY